MLEVTQVEVSENYISDIITSYEVVLVKYFYWHINNYDDALDLFQETSIKVFQNYESFRGESKLKTWIFTIARNTLSDFIKNKKRKRTISYDNKDFIYQMADSRINLESEYIIQEENKDVWNKINVLSLKIKQVFILKEIYHFKCNEISEILNIPLGTVYSRLHKAHKKLLKLIKNK